MDRLPVEMLEAVLLKAAYQLTVRGNNETRLRDDVVMTRLASVSETWWSVLTGYQQSSTPHWLRNKLRRALHGQSELEADDCMPKLLVEMVF